MPSDPVAKLLKYRGGPILRGVGENNHWSRNGGFRALCRSLEFIDLPQSADQWFQLVRLWPTISKLLILKSVNQLPTLLVEPSRFLHRA